MIDEDFGLGAMWHCHRCNMRGGADTDQAARDALDAHERNRHQLPLSADVREVRGIAEKHGLVPAPSTDIDIRKEHLAMQIEPLPPEGKPLTFNSIPIRDMSILERVEMLNKLNVPLRARLDDIDTSPDWICKSCGIRESAPTEAAAKAAHDAHSAGVEHDRATETKLRGNVKSALASVETARVALYDYLKSKGRVA